MENLPIFLAGSADLPDIAITGDMLKPVVSAITSNIGVILPVGLAIFGIMLGINLVPKLIKKFSGGK